MISRGQRIARAIFSRVFVDNNHDTANTVFVAGTGRSGTTWIGDLVNYRNDYRVIFEPFHPEYVSAVRLFGDRPYMRADDRDDARAAAALDVVSGRVRSRWSDGQNKCLYATRRVVKEIRANLMLRWLRELCPTTPVVLCLRHPCAVVNSRTTLGWLDHLESITKQTRLVEDHLTPWISLLEGAESALTRQTLMWCVETLVPLRQFSPGELQVVFYEHFCTEPREELARLFGYIGREFDDRVLQALGRPSWVSRTSSAVAERKDPLTAWQRSMSQTAIDEVLRTVEAFGLGTVYSESTLPDPEGVEKLLST